jgi:two-component system chemotaxis sensor kinase CheA
MDELLADYLAETTENLAALDEALLKLERLPGDAETLAVVFRLVHTIKGTSGFLNVPRIGKVAHAAEDLLSALREPERPATPAVITLVLAAIDRIKEIVAAVAVHEVEPTGHDAPLLGMLQAAQIRLATADLDDPVAWHNQAEDAPANQTTQSIRVNVTALENLMTLVSELVLTRNQLLQIARGDGDSRFNAPLQRLSHLTSDLQEGVMKTRMQPIRHAWSTFPRMVRDLAAELGKQIAIDMRGEDTELDRHVLELIRAPLAHMIRNCADHGLEIPAARIRAGKPAHGTIRLNSFHEGGTIVIEVGDDGAGLPTEKIRDRAIARQLVSASEVAAWGERQLHRLIFMPGLSTAASVTAVSGRGVGMDVVQTNIEQLGGTVEVNSQSGSGVTFTARIPLTLAIISALVLEAGGQRFALPQTCIAELVRVETDTNVDATHPSVDQVDGTPVLRLREKLLPLVSLARLLGLEPSSRKGGQMTIVVAQLGGLIAGLLVDQVFDTEEIVVKPASRLLRHIQVFSGNTILGDGSVIMILDPGGLSRAIGRPSPVAQSQISKPPPTITERSGDRAAMLLVRLATAENQVAVPLGLVSRIESIARGAIQIRQGEMVTQYRDYLMPLVSPASRYPDGDPLPVLIFSERGRSVGLIVAEIVDVVEDQLTIELTSQRPGLLGTALILGQITDVLDTAHWLVRGRDDWFTPSRSAGTETGTRLLVVEDSAFFRQLLLPALSASGYHVTAVDSASKALALRDGHDPASFDAIISDVDMPGIDGLQFARRLREGGRWSATPLIALSGRCNEADIARGSAAGFDEYVGKFDRVALLAALQRRLAPQERRAA